MTEAEVAPIQGRRPLVVEDDYFIAADLAASLEKLGVEVVDPVASVGEALDLIETAGVLDGAMLDIHLGGERVFPVANRMAARGVPYVFVTGYDTEAIPEAYAAAPRCDKPVNKPLLVRVLNKAGLG